MPEAKKHILVVDDDTRLRSLLQRYLREQGFLVSAAKDAAEAEGFLKTYLFDILIVDIMMPRMDGYEFTKTLRDGKCEIPILMLTAKISHEDKKKGFEVGTDDFLTKPFDDEELLWRVEALLRRSKIATEKKITVGSTTLDYASMSATVDGKLVTLTPKEFLLLFKLLSYPNQLFTKYQIMDEIWDFDTESDEHTVEVHINRLREKFKNNSDFYIKTIRGFGYMSVLENQNEKQIKK